MREPSSRDKPLHLLPNFQSAKTDQSWREGGFASSATYTNMLISTPPVQSIRPTPMGSLKESYWGLKLKHATPSGGY